MNKKGFGITFVDIDETLFRTFAKVKIIKDGKLVRELTNKEYNTYVLKEGETYNFEEFFDGKLFKKTSKPIKNIIARIHNMIERIKETKSKSKIVILTARRDFYDKEEFLETFIENGINVRDKESVYIYRAGNYEIGTVAEKKRRAVAKYLKEGIENDRNEP